MAQQTLFNRHMEFSLIRASTTDAGFSIEQTSPVFRWTDHKIEAQINKTIDAFEINTGSCSVTNIGQRVVRELVHVTEPRFFLYTLKAGYGDQLALISQGAVEQIFWRHEGGDTTADFSITEDSKFLENAYEQLGIKTIAKGSNISYFIDQILGASKTSNFGVLKIKYLGDSEAIRQELATTLIDAPVTITDMKKDLFDILDSVGYRYYVDNDTLHIQKLPRTPQDAIDQADAIVDMNFETGLLQADIENVMNHQYNVKEAWLNVKSLFIPEIKVGNIIRMNEPRYQHLKGDYIVMKLSASLNNKFGPFDMQARCISLDAINLVTGQTRREDFKERLQSIQPFN